MSKMRNPHLRKSSKKSLKKTFFVYCEGKTEKVYFQAYSGLTDDNIKIRTKNPNKTQDDLINYIIKDQTKNKEVKDCYYYCTIDGDVLGSTFKNEKKKANSKDINIIFCNPCFELWYLLHYQNNLNNCTNSSNVINELKKQYIFNYDKGHNYFDKLDANQKDAINNAKNIESSRNTDLEDCNQCNPCDLICKDCIPYTNVYKFVEVLNQHRKTK